MKIEDLLADCLTAIDEGATLDECLARYPEWRDDLAPLLRTALRVRAAPTVVPSARFRHDARDRMARLIRNRQVDKEPTGRKSRPPWLDRLWSPRGISAPIRRVALSGAAALTALLLVGLLTAGVAYASSDSLPGESLYPLKLAGERVRLALATNQETEIRFRLAFASERLTEARALAGRENEEQIDRVMQRYAAELEAASGVLRRLRDRDSGVAELSSYIEQEIAGQESVLSEIQDRVPEQARPAVERAMAASQQAREAALGPVDEPPGPPEGIETSRPGSAEEGGDGPTGDPPLRPTDTASPVPKLHETPTNSGPSGSESPGPPQGHSPPGQPPAQTRTPGPPENAPSPAAPGDPGGSGQDDHGQPPGHAGTPGPPGQDEPPGRDAEEEAVPPGQTRTPGPPARTRTPGPPGQN